MRSHHGSLDDALREWGAFEHHPDRRATTAAVVAKVIAADGSKTPSFYVTGAGSYVGVIGDDGHRLVRIQGRQIWSRCHIEGMSPRVTPPDQDLPFRWDL